MFKKFFVISMIVSCINGFWEAANIVHVTGNLEKIPRLLTKPIKEVNTPKGKVELPKELQNLNSTGNKEQQARSLAKRQKDICFFLLKTKKIPENECLEVIASMKLKEEDKIDADMV